MPRLSKVLVVVGCVLILVQETALFSLPSWRKVFALFAEFGFIHDVIGLLVSLLGAALDLLIAPVTWLGLICFIIAWRRSRRAK